MAKEITLRGAVAGVDTPMKLFVRFTDGSPTASFVVSTTEEEIPSVATAVADRRRFCRVFLVAALQLVEQVAKCGDVDPLLVSLPYEVGEAIDFGDGPADFRPEMAVTKRRYYSLLVRVGRHRGDDLDAITKSVREIADNFVRAWNAGHPSGKPL